MYFPFTNLKTLILQKKASGKTEALIPITNFFFKYHCLSDLINLPLASKKRSVLLTSTL